MRTTPYFSLGQIAQECGVAGHRVRYAIESRGITPACRIGHYRAFSAEQVTLIKAAVAEIDDRRLKSSDVHAGQMETVQ
jgi:DNA-binding transcriptional MerR regulator